MALLRNAMNESAALLIDQELESNPDVEYETYWASLDLEFGAEDKEVQRRRLKRLRLNTRGKVTEKEWRDYFVAVTTLAAQVGEVSDAELGRMMMDAVPVNPWRRKLATEEDKKNDAGNLILEGIPAEVTEADLGEMIFAETTAQPKFVRKFGEKFKVTPSGNDHRELIKKMYDRQRLVGGHLVKVSPDMYELGPREINDLMVRWLRVDQRIAGVADHEERPPERRPPPRWQREIDAETENSDEGQEVCQIERGRKGKGGKRPPTPPKDKKEKETMTKESAEVKAADAKPSQVPPPSPMVAESAVREAENAQWRYDGKGGWGGRGKGYVPWQDTVTPSGKGKGSNWYDQWGYDGKGGKSYGKASGKGGEKGKNGGKGGGGKGATTKGAWHE